MAALAWILLSVAFGCLLVYRFAGLRALQPRWAACLLVFGAGAPIGIGITSCLFFVLRPILPGVPQLALWVRLALLAALAYDCWRKRPPAAEPEPQPRFPYIPLLWVAFALSLGIVTYAMSTAWQANPQGNWDAWAIWNLRARFLAAGDGLASRAWSPLLNFTHPDYPLLLSGFVASVWVDSGSITNVAPIAASYLFFLALLATVVGGIAALRGPVPGVLAGLCLMGIPPVLHEVTSQYADVPLATFMAGATMFALLDYPAMAGLLAGFAAWTKDEGVLFLAILFAAIAVLKRPRLLRFCYGAAPAAALVLVFKFAIARGTNSLMGGAQGSMASKLGDWNRYQITASAIARELFTWNVGWYHPVLPIAVLAIVLGFDRSRMRDGLFCLAIGLSLQLGYFGVYVITPYELRWQLQSSLTRLFVQISPILLIAAFVAMRAPELAPIVEPVKPDLQQRRKGKR
jgi:hypothetical protein